MYQCQPDDPCTHEGKREGPGEDALVPIPPIPGSLEERLDVLPEARMIRALAQDYIARYNELKDALLEWNRKESLDAAPEDRKPRPQRLPELHEAASLLESASRVVEKIHKRESQNAISRNDLFRMMGEMGRVVDTLVEDQDIKDQIKDVWLSIRL